MILIFRTSSPELLPSFMNPFIPDPFNPNKDWTSSMSGPFITSTTWIQIVPKNCRTFYRFRGNFRLQKNGTSPKFNIRQIDEKRRDSITDDVIKLTSIAFARVIEMRFILAPNPVICNLKILSAIHRKTCDVSDTLPHAPDDVPGLSMDSAEDLQIA